MKKLFAALTLSFVCPLASQAAERLLLRFPDVHGDTVVFVYAGDLWTVSTAGGTARRLTAHPGLERSPKFSPDGRFIAFNGQYDGDEQVYVIPTGGGEPRQLTYYPAQGPLPARWGFDNQVLGWSPDGERILMRSIRARFDLSDGKLYDVPVAGGLPRPLPMPEAGLGEYSPDGKKVVYSPHFRDFRTWKRYQGGWAQELWTFDLASHESRRVTEHVRADRDPMWIGDEIWFNSDRSGTFNLWAFDLGSGETRQITTSTTLDVRWPSADASGQIVYELGGRLNLLDTKAGTTRALAVDVPDDGLARRPQRVSAADDVEYFTLSPGGERAVFSARGEIFNAPIEHGPTFNLSNTPGAHERDAQWSADGRWIVFIADRDGEEEIWRVDSAGKKPAEQLTDGGKAHRREPRISPDGDRVAFSDKDGKLYVLTIASKKVVEIARDPFGSITDHVWSPDSKFLAFTLLDKNRLGSIWVWSLADGQVRRVTSALFHEERPAWDPEGKYLYYLGDRDFAPQIAAFEWNYANARETGVFALALRRDVRHPFPPRIDTVGAKKDDDEAEKKAAPAITIDFDGIEGRAARVPIDGGEYSALVAVPEKLLLFEPAAPFYGRDGERSPRLQAYSFEDRELETLVEKLDAFAVSHDGEKVLALDGETWTLYEAGDGKDEPKKVSTAGLVAERVPREEWAQIFDEVWRRFRDYFYVENMHGYDWEALRARYRPLVEHVGHRDDLTYVLGEMIAELNVSHAYVTGGDFEVPDRPKVALLGALLELDAKAGRYRLARIWPGHNEEPLYRSPLREIGVEATEGEYLLAIDGEELKANDEPYRLLRHKADRPVTLTLNKRPSLEGARQVTIQPITDEVPLRYLDWVEKNRKRVAELSGGKLGYVHIPDMGPSGIYEFTKWFYPQLDRQGMVIDVRNNGGGNVSAWIIERLRREVLAVTFARTWSHPSSYPGAVVPGPMACILDEDSSSDGDIFPHMFRQAGLGPLIGKRSWGGVIGIAGRGPLLDGGSVSVPEFGFLSPKGEWIIEGHGVEPDVEVDNDPISLLAGRDPQLERAVEEVLKRLPAEHVPPLTNRPPGPIKTP